jgi:4-carboxymuconolactone decarboxylase
MSVLEMDPSKWPAPARELFDSAAARRKAEGVAFGGPYIALYNHPELARRIEEAGFYLKFEGVLPRPVYQFIVLSVAHATGSGFVWGDHVEHALAAGLSHEVVDAVGAGRTEALPEPYTLISKILTATMAWRPVPDVLQARAATEWGAKGLVEIVVVCGFYQMFAAINQGFAGDENGDVYRQRGGLRRWSSSSPHSEHNAVGSVGATRGQSFGARDVLE